MTRFRDSSVGMLAISRQFEVNPPSGSGGAIVGGDMIAAALAQVGDTPIYSFPSARTLERAAALSPSAFLAGYLAALDEVYAEVSTLRRIVGIIDASESLAHALYRRDDGARRKKGRVLRGNAPPPEWAVTVLNLRRGDGTWRAMLNREIASEQLRFIQMELDPRSRRDRGTSG